MSYRTLDDGEQEHTLPLPNHRQIAFADNGNRSSRIVVLFFSGYLSVGSAGNIPTPLQELDVHFIAPTLPGNAESSTIIGVPYNVGLCNDITALLKHLHPDGIDKLYVAGGSYGTVAAQIVYGAPYDLFPFGHNIAGLLIAAGFSPFKHHIGYSKSMTWQNWLSVGPPSQWFPFRLVPRLFQVVIASRMVKNVLTAKKFMHEFMISHMDEDEKLQLEQWLAKQKLTEDEWIMRMAEGAVRCTKNWDGFLEGSDVLHLDWGFVPKELGEEHQKPVLIVGSDKDDLGSGMNKWLKENYTNSKLEIVHGGHIAALFHMDEIWRELLLME